MESPLHTAHQHAADADDYLNEGLLIKARDKHFEAAKAFKECKPDDSKTKRTLDMLSNEHINAAKELERKINRLREEGKDPTLPQKRSGGAPASIGSVSRLSYPAQNAISSSSMRLMDSHNNVDESFMVLGQRSDPGDAFNKFWKIMEGMLDNLSQPVAFMTAPLGKEPKGLHDLRKHSSSSSEKDREGPLVNKSRKLKPDSEFIWEQGSNGETEEEVLVDEGNDLSESFYLIPSGPEPSMSALSRENVTLKREAEEMQKRLAAAERVLHLRKEQDQQLRDSIVLARQQAQRAMGTSFMVPRPTGQSPSDLTALNINLPAAPVTALNAGREREAQHFRRVRELEDELRAVRTENEKQKMMIARFRERWEKLKESAKRKKDAKAAAQTSKIGPGDRIDEDPEAERELDEVCNRP